MTFKVLTFIAHCNLNINIFIFVGPISKLSTTTTSFITKQKKEKKLNFTI